ncbi:MAG: lamin tail domain-containing protein [Patescibacteria group bacterium]
MQKRGHSLRLVGRALIVAMGILPLLHPATASASSPLVIGEVAWSGSSLSIADEWVELWNLGDADMPLAGYRLENAGTETVFLPEDAVIPAHGVYLITNYAADDPKSALALAPDLVTTAVSLSNSSLSISLVDGNGTIVDTAGDGGAPPAGTTGDIKASMVRDGDTWSTATASDGFDTGSTSLGTPGICDGCVMTVEEVPPPIETPPSDDTATSTDTLPPVSAPDAAISTGTTPLPETSATSSPVVPPADTVGMTSSTDNAPLATTEEPTIATSAAEASASTQPATASSDIVATTADELPARYDFLRLNEIQAQPDGDGEWIEITSLDLSVTIPLTGVQLRDAVGKIYTFTSGTIDVTTPFVQANLSSSRLNNDGDTVSLHGPDGVVIDTLIFEGSEKGAPWARDEDAVGTWRLTHIPTPGEPNIIADPNDMEEAPVQTIPVATPETPIVTLSPPGLASVTMPAVTPKVTLPSAVATAGAKTAATKATASAVSKTPSAKATVAKPIKTTAVKTTKTPSTKTTTSTAPQPIPITIAMTSSDTYRGIRVTLQGTVGSPSGLLTSHGFILLAPDGRGLLVRVPTAKKLPAFGETVQVTGTLQFDDLDIPSLKLGTKDGWTILSESAVRVVPRTVDLLAPGSEDRWSLISTTGDVVRVQATTVTMRVDGADVVVAIRKVVDYRASRLTVGDTVRVTGVLDLSRDTPRILPRVADEIVLVSHAAPTTTASTMKKALPGWSPFGAAGLAIAGTEGLKHYRERRKRKSLETMLETCSNETNAE